MPTIFVEEFETSNNIIQFIAQLIRHAVNVESKVSRVGLCHVFSEAHGTVLFMPVTKTLEHEHRGKIVLCTFKSFANDSIKLLIWILSA
jgi:hypothetical protein